MTAAGAPTTLLTGATGLVGGALLARLLAESDRRVVVLARPGARADALAARAGVTVLRGDLTRPDLGLDASDQATLAREVSGIVHCGADTRFDLPLETARAVNTAATDALLGLARRCRRLEKLVHVSTVYVAGRATGSFGEAPLRHAAGFTNTYQQSKYEAEQLVVAAMADVPASIVRLSSLIGDSRTGRVSRFNHVHQLMKLLPHNVLPIVPGVPPAPLDLIPTDWAVAALSHLVQAGFRPGAVQHLCAGPERSRDISAVMAMTTRAYERHPEGRRWLPIHAPRPVTLAEFEAYVDRRRRESDRLLNELLRVLGYFVPHLGLYQAFENAKTQHVLAAAGLAEAPDLDTYYEKVVHHGLDTGWGKRPEPCARS